MAVTPMPAEILAAEFRALLKQPHPDDHGFLPNECFRVLSMGELDNSQLICYRQTIAYNGTYLLYCARRTNHVDRTKRYRVRRSGRSAASGAHGSRWTDDASRSRSQCRHDCRQGSSIRGELHAARINRAGPCKWTLRAWPTRTADGACQHASA